MEQGVNEFDKEDYVVSYMLIQQEQRNKVGITAIYLN